MLYVEDRHWRRLKLTAARIYRGTYRDRADWMELYYKSGAWLDLRVNGDAVHERFGITERTRDSCGEMGDCPEYARRVDRDSSLAAAITQAEGEGCLNHWRELATEVPQLALF